MIETYGLPVRFIFRLAKWNYLVDFHNLSSGGNPRMVVLGEDGKEVGEPFFSNTPKRIANLIGDGHWKLVEVLEDEAALIIVEDLL